MSASMLDADVGTNRVISD